ncbi:MAG: hypothetical protein EHM58_12445 [Ignavibacteriae bacterium]|nr:MAG: hypothetical protein EHM58_12445 [Ignavibacteriota bacterium]
MKELLLNYVNYNLWANTRICNVLEKLDESLLDKELVSSFPTIRETIYHVWGAEFIWYKRLQGESLVVWPFEDFKGKFADAQIEFLKQSELFIKYIFDMPDESLTSKIDYSSMDGTKYNNKICNIIQHVMNHSTFHRGQVITMLRNIGVTELPSTDFIIYTRINKQ